MSKTIIFSILGASVIAYVVISKDSSELSTNKLNSANSLEQRQGAISYKDNEANVPVQHAIGQPELEPRDDTEFLNANKINSPGQENIQETNEKGSSPEQSDASAKKTDPENKQAGPNQSIDTSVHTLNNKASDEQEVSTITSRTSVFSNNQADDSASTETSDDNELNGDEENDSNIEETSDVDDNDAGIVDDDDSDDDKAKGLVGNWSGTMAANGNGCEGANMYISLYDSPPQYFLGGSVETFPGHLNIDDKISYEIIGSVTYKGNLSAKLTQIFPGAAGVSDYQVDYNGSLSETKGDGTWRDNRSCSGTWSINKY